MSAEMVTLDWHGFSRLAPKPTKPGEVIAVPLQCLLRGTGIESPSLGGKEEVLLVWTVQFKLAGGRYLCAGCAICRSDELERRLRAVGEAAAESVIRTLLAPNGIIRNIFRAGIKYELKSMQAQRRRAASGTRRRR